MSSTAPPQQSRQRHRLRRAFVAAGLLLCGSAAWLFLPIKADLRTFDARGVGEAEALMWRHYYEPRHAWLAVDLYRVARRAYGLSPFDSLRIGWHAARAATLFHGTNDRERHQAAETHLRSYYAVLAWHLHSVNVPGAAGMELLWWRQHRVRDYQGCAQTLASLSAAVYGGNPHRYDTAARRRVDAMIRCDRRSRLPLGEQDWAAIRGLLIESYQALADSVSLGKGE